MRYGTLQIALDCSRRKDLSHETWDFPERMYIAGQSSAHGALLCLVQSIVVSSSCRASHTGDAIRVMYSSVNVGVVHVLGACVQVQSTG